ncbi:MAG: hypothetical protein AcusKO_04430 [Acuticoccus sp.]
MPDIARSHPPTPGPSLVPALTALAAEAEAAGYMDIADWARCEAEGYRGDVPPYRRVAAGRVRGFAEASGWQPLPDDPAAIHGLTAGVADLEAAVAAAREGLASVRLDDAARAAAAFGGRFVEVVASVDVRDLQSLLFSVASLADRWRSQIAARTTLAGVPAGRAAGARRATVGVRA